MVAIRDEVAFALKEIIQKRTHTKMLSIIQEENAEYTKKNMTPFFRRVKDKLKRVRIVEQDTIPPTGG